MQRSFLVFGLLLLANNVFGADKNDIAQCASPCVNQCLPLFVLPTQSPALSSPPPKALLSPPPPKALLSPPPPKALLSPPPPKALLSPPPPKARPPPPIEEDFSPPDGFTSSPPYDDDDVSSPPPPSQEKDKMTDTFPLGSCKMGGPSLPYTLNYSSYTPGLFCMTINFSPNYTEACAQRKLTGACNMMVKNVNKIVFWYKQIDTCGFNFTKSKKSLNLFPWIVRDGNSNVVAAKYRITAQNATSAHAAGDMALFKWVWQKISSVQVDINRSGTFKRGIDESLNGYRVCMVYDPTAIDALNCITYKNNIRYSFYDPKKTICTVGTLSLDPNVFKSY